MLSNLWKGRNNTESKNLESKSGNINHSKKCKVCNSKEKGFIKNQEASELLSNLGIETLDTFK